MLVPSLMLQEIHAQPTSLAATIASLSSSTSRVADLTRSTRRVIFYARGTSACVASYGRLLLNNRSICSAVVGQLSTVLIYGQPPGEPGDLLVLVSQSGETGELVDIADLARESHMATIGITNQAGSSLARSVDIPLITEAGPEQALPATKTFTAAMAAVAFLAAVLEVPRNGKLLADFRHVAADAAELIHGSTPDIVGRAADLLGTATAVCVAARGYLDPVAHEIALKIQESSGVPALALSAAELQHGPAMALGPSVPLILISSAGSQGALSIDAAAEEARRRKAHVIRIGETGFDGLSDAMLPGSRLAGALAPITAAIPGQLLAEALARLRHLDPDLPIGLNKVTQTV